MRKITLFLALFLAVPVFGGTFYLSDSTLYEPFIVVHPAPYDGTNGGDLEVRVCIAADSGITAPATREAIEIWNAFAPTTGNCANCRTIEQGPAKTEEPNSMTTVVLHELGHCALGLGHINWKDPATMSSTSFTNTKDAQSFSDGGAGGDGIRGSSDDSPTPLPGSRVLHWFRQSDNDPFVIDSTVIDISTYSRRINQLPAGSLWMANGNYGVALLLGHLNTQAVMYTHIDQGQKYSGLTADAINTVTFGMSGMDETAGTGDDYTVTLVASDCASADVEIIYTEFEPDMASSLGSCLVDLEPLSAGGIIVHHALRPFVSRPRAEITINSAKFWDVVFADGFEVGTASNWSDTAP